VAGILIAEAKQRSPQQAGTLWQHSTVASLTQAWLRNHCIAWWGRIKRGRIPRGVAQLRGITLRGRLAAGGVVTTLKPDNVRKK
jgi:hypothetical protein